MLRRACIWLVLAAIAALFGFSGIVQVTAFPAQIAAYVCAGFGLFSLLLSLFEESQRADALQQDPDMPAARY